MSEKLLNIENIRNCIIYRNVVWTRHCLNRINQRNILISDVKQAIKNGEIIEYYYDDYPYPSCLIIGKNKYNEIMHVVCGIDNNFVYMITAYYPDNGEWEEDMKTRREG